MGRRANPLWEGGEGMMEVYRVVFRGTCDMLVPVATKEEAIAFVRERVLGQQVFTAWTVERVKRIKLEKGP
jgi:hypothetical protein